MANGNIHEISRSLHVEEQMNTDPGLLIGQEYTWEKLGEAFGFKPDNSACTASVFKGTGFLVPRTGLQFAELRHKYRDFTLSIPPA
jgi:hypothetical protein